MNSFQTHQWWADPRTCTLENGAIIKLDYKQMQLLCYLANNSDEVITRNELLNEIWPNQHIADDVLNVAISGLRKALGDDSKSPKFIKTIPRVGYQFIAPVSFVKKTLNTNGIFTKDIPRSLMLAGVLISAIAVLAIIVALIWFVPASTENTNHKNSDEDIIDYISANKLNKNTLDEGKSNANKLDVTARTKPRLAILPMTLRFSQTEQLSQTDPLSQTDQLPQTDPLQETDQPLQTDSQQHTSKQYLANGIVTSIIDQMAANPELTVFSRQTMFHPDRLTTTEAEFLASLNADYFLQSSMTFQENKLEISSQLLFSTSQEVLWKGDYSIDEHEIYETQIHIVNEINQRFEASQVTVQDLRKPHSTQEILQFTAKAYDHYLRGQHHVRNNQLKDAETQFLASVNETSDFALGYAGLAQLYFLKAWSGADKTLNYLKVADRYTQKAWQLDPDDWQVLLNKALSAYFLEYEPEKALLYFERAQQKNPSEVMLLEWFQSFLINTGQFEKAKITNQKMRDVSPLLFNKTAYYDILYLSGDFNGALTEIETINPYMNSTFWASAASSWVYLAKKEPEQFASYFVLVLQGFNLEPTQIENFQQTLSAQGIEVAIALVLEFTEGTLDSYSKAELLAYIGKSDEALNILEKKVNNREIQMFRISQEPLFRSLHSETKFQELLNILRTPVL